MRVVRPPQGRHHLSGYVLIAAVALGPVEPLVVLCADVLARVVEETRVHQITAAHCDTRRGNTESGRFTLRNKRQTDQTEKTAVDVENGDRLKMCELLCLSSGSASSEGLGL